MLAVTVILRSPPDAGDEEPLRSFDISRGILRFALHHAVQGFPQNDRQRRFYSAKIEKTIAG